jgi:uncharacterized protein YkwD
MINIGIQALIMSCLKIFATPFPSTQPPATQPPATPVSQEDEFLAIHNKLRALVGSEPVTWNTQMATAASNWNNVQCSQGQYYHSDYSYAENLALGLPSATTATQAWFNEYQNIAKACPTGPSQTSCVQDYMNTHFSSAVGEVGHFINVVNPDTTQIGCSGSLPCSNYKNYIYWTCEYNGYTMNPPTPAVIQLFNNPTPV